jgi:hypothetical protein
MTFRAFLLVVVTALGLSVGFVAFTPATPAFACSCVADNQDERADLIVAGTVVEVTDDGIELAVDSVEKGIVDVGSTLSLNVSQNEAACGYPFRSGVRYRVPSYLRVTGLCSGIRGLPAATSVPAPVAPVAPVAPAASAAPDAPAPALSGASGTTLVAAGGIATALVGVVVLVLRRRRTA